MSKILSFTYGLIAYAAFLIAILYAIGFVGSFVVPKNINSGTAGPIGISILINAFLLALFAIQHTIMARPGFKKWWTQITPVQIERSTFVLIASLILLLLYWQWRPMPTVLWSVDNAVGKSILVAINLLGWALVFYSSFLIDHFDLFGLRQVYLYLVGKEYTHPIFRKISLYKRIRHPLMLGFLLAFWSTPLMSLGHLLFSGLTTAYIFIGIQFEERDLLQHLGEDYTRYRKETPMVLPTKWGAG